VDLQFIWNYARAKKKKRIDICDFDGILGATEVRMPLLKCNMNEMKVLMKFNLHRQKYIVVNRDVDIAEPVSHPKLWPIEYYNELLQKIKNDYPDIRLIRIGFRSGMENMRGIDYDLTGKTTLNELKVILKHSQCLFGSEGGLIHINHFLGGKSVVFYGPTDENYFGYKEDVICVSRGYCNGPCNYVTENWTEKCVMGLEKPECMKNLKPSIVYEEVKPLLEEIDEIENASLCDKMKNN